MPVDPIPWCIEDARELDVVRGYVLFVSILLVAVMNRRLPL
jgi:hypothetical protein